MLWLPIVCVWLARYIGDSLHINMSHAGTASGGVAKALNGCPSIASAIATVLDLCILVFGAVAVQVWSLISLFSTTVFATSMIFKTQFFKAYWNYSSQCHLMEIVKKVSVKTCRPMRNRLGPLPSTLRSRGPKTVFVGWRTNGRWKARRPSVLQGLNRRTYSHSSWWTGSHGPVKIFYCSDALVILN